MIDVRRRFLGGNGRLGLDASNRTSVLLSWGRDRGWNSGGTSRTLFGEKDTSCKLEFFLSKTSLAGHQRGQLVDELFRLFVAFIDLGVRGGVVG